LHYGQTVFEGMKAFSMTDGRTNIFRIDRHYERFVKSLERMCMAVPPKEIFIEGLARLVEIDKAWIPKQRVLLYTCGLLFMQAKQGLE
jgi:branched-chain amino acid aminotransferase